MTSLLYPQSWLARIFPYTYPLRCPGDGVSLCTERRGSFIHSTVVSAHAVSGPLGTRAAEEREVPAVKELAGSRARLMNKKGENQTSQS